jgi:hypothetical protein
MEETITQQARRCISFMPCSPGESTPPQPGDRILNPPYGVAYVGQVRKADPAEAPVAYWYSTVSAGGGFIAWWPLNNNETTRPKKGN